LEDGYFKTVEFVEEFANFFFGAVIPYSTEMKTNHGPHGPPYDVYEVINAKQQDARDASLKGRGLPRKYQRRVVERPRTAKEVPAGTSSRYG
jgi:hypothetical protein